MGETAISSRADLIARFRGFGYDRLAFEKADALPELKDVVNGLSVSDVSLLPLWMRVWGLDRQSECAAIGHGLRSEEAVALASFSSDGYIRAAALSALVSGNWRLARSFAMLRMADWVPEVADIACRAVRGWFMAAAAGEMVVEWPVFVSICRRDWRGRAMAIFDELLGDSLRGPAWIIRQVNASASGADAAWAVQHVLRRTGDHAGLIPDLVRSPFCTVRVIGAQAARRLPGAAASRDLVNALAADPMPSVRRECVYLLERADDSLAHDTLTKLRTDRSAAVRQSALFYLESRFGHDRRGLARMQMGSSVGAEASRAAVDFCAVARREDLGELRALAFQGPARVRVSAIRARQRLGDWRVPEDTLAFALDRSAPVARLAIRLTDGREHAISVAAWTWIIRQAPVAAVRHAAGVRVCAGHPFKGLALLMRESAAADQSSDVRAKFADSLSIWCRPPYLQVSDLERALLAESWSLFGDATRLSPDVIRLLDELRVRLRKPFEPL